MNTQHFKRLSSSFLFKTDLFLVSLIVDLLSTFRGQKIYIIWVKTVSECLCLTSVVLHACVVCDSLRPEAEAQDVSRVRTVSDQEGSVRFPLQLHLCILPVHRTPVPATLKRKQTKPSAPSDNRPSKCPRKPNILQKHPLHLMGRSFTSSVLHQNLPLSIKLTQVTRKLKKFHSAPVPK